MSRLKKHDIAIMQKVYYHGFIQLIRKDVHSLQNVSYCDFDICFTISLEKWS